MKRFLVLACLLVPGVSRGTNLVLITIDTLRADHLPAYGYARVKTPALDGLVHDGILFKRALAHAPITVPSHTSIMTGLYPMTHGVRNNGDYYVPDGLTTMAKLLKGEGYETAAFVSSFLLHQRFGLDGGFDAYDADMSEGRPKTMPTEFLERRGGVTLERAMKWLGTERKEPFLLWAHFYDPHQPYDPPEPFRGRYKARPYDGEIAYVDSLLKTLFDELKKKGLYDDALIVVTGDHGESLGEHGEAAHGVFIYEPTVRVPLVLKLPGNARAGTRIEPVARHIDILPTVLDVLGIKGPPDLPGTSLLGPPGDRVSYAESYLPRDYYGWSELASIVKGSHRYIEAPRPELYDISKDTAEADNIIATQGALAAQLRTELEGLKKKHLSVEAGARAAKELDPQVLAGLKALGYMGQTSSPAQTGKDPKDMLHWENDVNAALGLGKAGEHEKVVETLLPLLKANPENQTARSILAGAYRKLKRLDEAVREYREIRERDPKFLAAYEGLVGLYTKDKADFEAAERELAAAFLIAPKEPSLWVLKADIEQEKGAIERALEFYLKAQGLGEQSAGLAVGLGSAFNKLGRLAEAEKSLVFGLRLEPENAEAHYNLGVVYDRGGAASRAEEQYRLAIRYDPKNYLSYGNLGGLYQRLGKVPEALAALRAALAIKPDDVTSLYNLGSTLLTSGRPKEAVEPLKKALDLDPGLAFARNNLALTYARLGQSELAFEHYKLLAEDRSAQAPMRAAAWRNMAGIRKAQGRQREAEECLKAAAKIP